MRLERLEISGFKSFSDRSELSFDQGVTAIVGPNGCGKSNVADALTWVMGEQSAKSLRGEKMEDVIFSGSDARKPTGTAEVRLRFSGVTLTPVAAPGPLQPHPELPPTNGNGHSHAGGNGVGHGNGRVEDHPMDALMDAVREVEVTRRLYRSGESEYLIDGHSCRLKDIHELLMDTGLGAKAYAIIEQGKIGLILSSRPTDRRLLIEEAAGITKYKARRRAAELKLEAAQLNLTRIDDIVYEIDKQRGALKRQAAKARRYTRLRDEMRRWEKVLFARRFHALAEVIESARARLADTREQEAGASARLADVENELGRMRIELAEAEAAATRAREAAHAGELEINRRQQQIALDAQQAEMLQRRSTELETERITLEGRREPERVALDERRAAAIEALRLRDEAAALAADVAAEHQKAQQSIEAAEQDVERARSEVYAVMNTVTALTAALHAATAQRERAAEVRGRLEMEAADLQTEHDRAIAGHAAAHDALTAAHDSLDTTRIARAARESELANARVEHEWRARDVRTREHELASVNARLTSLEELDAHRSGFSDAARMVLVHANGHVGQLGALADFIEVDPRYERAVEAHLGELLQHVLVRRHEHASAGLALVRQANAGRCGFVVLESSAVAAVAAGLSSEARSMAGAPVDAADALPTNAVMLSSIIRVAGEHALAIREAIGDAVIVESFDVARELASELSVAVATVEGDVLRGPHLVTGGAKVESRGILATKREIKELRERVTIDREALDRLTEETARFEHAIAHATAAVAALSSELHRQEKAIVGVEGQLQRATEDEVRLSQRRALVATETARVQDEIVTLDARQVEARDSISKLDDDRRAAETMLADAQRTLFSARETSDMLAGRAAEARATQAALVERSAGAAADVRRLEDAARELERRVETCASDLTLMRDQRQRLLAAVAEGYKLVDDDVRVLEELRGALRESDQKAQTLKASTDGQEDAIRNARRVLDAVRSLAAELDVTRATAAAELTHLAQQCLDTVNVPLEEIRVEVAQMEAAGDIEPDVNAIRAAETPDPDEDDAEASPDEDGHDSAAGLHGAGEGADIDAPVIRMTAEEAITELRAKI
ncbi:MAG: AAA family ATPase, partial [Acidobacteria bacterium]|nr:AAA family ATPase [Acidobacteriota bacterium]